MGWIDAELVLIALAAMFSPTTLWFSVFALVLADRRGRTGLCFYSGTSGAPLALGVIGAFVIGDVVASDAPSPRTSVVVIDVVAAALLLIWSQGIVRRRSAPRVKRPVDTVRARHVGWKPRENDGVEPLTARVPVGPEYPLVAKAGPVHEAQGRDILRCDEHLEAAKAERAEGPAGDEPHRLGRDTAATRRRNQAAPELAHPVFAHRQHHLAEVGVAEKVGDDEIEQTAVFPALFEILDDPRAVGPWKRRHPKHRSWILAELVGSVEVLDPERAQNERPTDEGWLRVGDGRIDRNHSRRRTVSPRLGDTSARSHPDWVMPAWPAGATISLGAVAPRHKPTGTCFRQSRFTVIVEVS
jgi:hypothetical protein